MDEIKLDNQKIAYNCNKKRNCKFYIFSHKNINVNETFFDELGYYIRKP